MLSSHCWVASANVVKTSTTIQPANAIDGDEKTRYSTGTDAMGSEWFQVDLCHPATISGLSVYTGTGGGDAAENARCRCRSMAPSGPKLCAQMSRKWRAHRSRSRRSPRATFATTKPR